MSTALLAASCATNKPNRTEIRHFDPLPATEVAVEDLEPITPESLSKLLGDAEQAFREANAAQERGDHQGALRQYTAMLELLIEADLDPKVFYQLRSEFERILDTSFREARLFDPSQTRTYHLADLPEFSSDIEIPNPLPQAVLDEIRLIQNAYPERFQSALNRSGKYLPYIRDELARAGLPQDLCWLVMVESQFTPKINSPAGAGGMWQFMKTTGKRYNLRIDGHVDERYDWQRSTHAAIGYLRDLYIFFDGDWSLAVTAYNMGEGGLSRAMNASNGERNIWTLISEGPSANIIRSETKKYYPRFLASIIVAKNPDRYGFTFTPQQPDNFIKIPVEGSYSIASLEKSTGLADGTLAALNPHLIRGLTPPDGPYQVAVPSDFGQKVQLALQSAPRVKADPPRAKADAPRVHVVRRGETLAEIARKYNVSTRELTQLNKLRSANHLLVGQKLVLSPNASGAPAAPVEQQKSNVVVAKSAPTSSGGAKPKTYKVKRGDTLFEIAQTHHVSVDDLQAWNNMNRSSRIRIGESLVVSMPDVEAVKAPQEVVPDNASADAPIVAALAEQKPEVAPRYHTVQRGEFPAKIAKLYGVGVDEFLKWNKLTASSSIHAGQKLVVYADAPKIMGTSTDVLAGKVETPKPAAPAAPATHKVQRGETASTIAAHYKVKTSDLLKTNNLTGKSILRVGDELKIPAGSSASGKASKPEGERIEHVVAAGHNPTTIARRYGVSIKDLFAWNGWQKAPTLHPGDKVVVMKK